MSIAPINIAVGTYDGAVAGLSLESDSQDALKLTTHFASGTHASAVRSCALHGSTLVTGGADEVIRLYDVSKRVEVGTLLHHEGTVNALRFVHDHGRNLLFSAGDDAAVCVWRMSDWHLLKRLTGHQAGVIDVAVHPSASVALTVSADRAFFMWNLARGKIAFSVKTKGGVPPSAVRWAPDGNSYALCAGTTVTISDVQGRNVRSLPHERNVLCAQFLDENTLVTGGEDPVVQLWDCRVKTKQPPNVAFRHDARIQDISVVDKLLFTADSMGGLKIWDSRKGGEPRIETNMATAARITCMTVAHQAWTPPSRSEEDAVEDETDLETNINEQNRGKGKKRVRGGKDDRTKKTPEKELQGTASQRKRKKRKMQKQGQKE